MARKTEILLTSLLTVLLFQVKSEAQITSRSELLEAEREAKVTQVAPPKRTTIERGMKLIENGLKRYENIKGKDPGLHYMSGNLPTGSGFGFGLGYTYKPKAKGGYDDSTLANRVALKLGAAYSTRDYYELKTEFRWMNIAGGPINAAWGAKYFENPEEDFFGIGPDSQRHDRTNYLYRSLEGGTDVWLAPLKGFRGGGGVSYIHPSVGAGRDPRFASLETRFDPTTVAGFQGDAPDFLRLDAFLDYDRRDNPDYPRSGTFLGSKFSNYSDRGHAQFDFQRWELEAQQYLRFDDGYKVIALRGNVVMTDADGADTVPFYLMPSLGGTRLRGFRESRFRDQNSVLATAEYRWEAWWALDVALFADTGKVVPRRADINLQDLELGYGIGFRFHSRKAFTFRLDLARSRDGIIPIFSGTHVF